MLLILLLLTYSFNYETIDLQQGMKIKDAFKSAMIKLMGKLDILINNAGLGDFGYLTDTDLNKDLELFQCNCHKGNF